MAVLALVAGPLRAEAPERSLRPQARGGESAAAPVAPVTPETRPVATAPEAAPEPEVAAAPEAAAPEPDAWFDVDVTALAPGSSVRPQARRSAPEETMRRAVARCLSAVGGRGGPPARGERLDRLVAALRRGGPGGGPGGGPEGGLGGGRTLAGCRILPRGAGGARLAICREDAAAERRTIEGPGVADWDGRFRVTVSPDLWDFAARAGPCRLVPAGPAAPTRMATLGVPAAARRALPALEAGGRIVATAEFDGRNATPVSDSLLVLEAVWRPPEAMAGPGFGIA